MKVKKQHSLLAYLLIGIGIYFLLRQWLLEGIEKTPQELAELIMRMIRFYAE